MMNSISFRGASNVTVDAKGRLGIPSRYRQALDESCKGKLIVTADADGCLLIYPAPSWQPVEEALFQEPSTDKHVRFLQRLMVGHATECEMDSQGRVLLASPLREYANIKKRGILFGQRHRFELWDKARWEQERERGAEEKIGSKESEEALKNVRF